MPASAAATTRPEYDSPSALARLLDAEGLAMSKRLGQNFLVNRGIREKILGAVGREAGDRVWEIGPGIGSMTSMLLDAGLEVAAFEIDHGFARLLNRVFGEEERFRLVEGDFLDTWPGELETRGPPDIVIGNLPYNAAAAMVASLLEGGVGRRLVFTVQREVAQRMAAKPGGKDYSSFTVLCASSSSVRILFDIGGGSFWPAPRVTSSVVAMEPLRSPLASDDRKGFSRFVRQSFSSRRKTLRNNLKAAGWTERIVDGALDALGIDRAVRAEALAPDVLAALYSHACAAGPRAPTIEPL